MATTDYGWVGKILFVDLTSGKIETVPTGNYVPKWLGGRALAAKLYWDEVPPSCGALDPENRLIFATGPVAGTPGAGSTRTSVAAKSPMPVPECYMFSTPGGHWSAELKFAGYDALVVRGKASQPSYLLIQDGQVKVLRAGRLWGMTTNEADAEIRRMWGDRSRSMLIGPAGENLVKSAVILTNLTNATGMGGFGAVMGSKNLKAVVVRGTGGVKVARPKDLIDFYDVYVKNGGKYGGPYPVQSVAYGITHNLSPNQKATTPDIDEWFDDEKSDWVKYDLGHEEVVAGTIKQKMQGCFSCPACCGLVNLCLDPTGKEPAPRNIDVPFVSGQQCHEYPYWSEVEIEKFGGKKEGRANILNAASYQNLGILTWCMSYHLDWFKAAVDAKLLSKETTGLPIGDYCSEEFVGKNGYQYGITYRRNDFYKRLAEGPQRFLANMAQENPAWKPIFDKSYARKRYYMDRTGTPSDPFAMLNESTAFRSQPNSTYQRLTQASKQLDKCFATDAEVADAIKAARAKWAPLLGPKSFDLANEPKTFEGKVRPVIFFQHMQIEADSMPYCTWLGYPRFYSVWTSDHLGDPAVGAKMLAAVTGIDRTMEENVNSMEATWNLERAIRVREGQRRQDDTYVDSVYETNKAWASKEVFNKVLDEYYTTRGWDVATGIPTRKKLEALGLKDVADDLENKYNVKVPA